MANKKDIEIVAAGHTCLDLIPAFTIGEKVDNLTDVLIPGKMINMGECRCIYPQVGRQNRINRQDR